MSFPITCTACHKTFTISDEIYEKKVAGRVVTIKCKSCGQGIRVDGTGKAGGPAQPEAAAPAPAAVAAAQPAPAAPAAPAPTAAPAEPPAIAGEPLWAVDYADGQNREFTTAEVVKELERGAVNGETLVWREGMGEWLELRQVPELAGEHTKLEEKKKKAAEAAAAAKAAAAPQVHKPRARMPTVAGIGGYKPKADGTAAGADFTPAPEPATAFTPKAPATATPLPGAKAPATATPLVGAKVPAAATPLPGAKLPAPKLGGGFELGKPRAAFGSAPELGKTPQPPTAGLPKPPPAPPAPKPPPTPPPFAAAPAPSPPPLAVAPAPPPLTPAFETPPLRLPSPPNLPAATPPLPDSVAKVVSRPAEVPGAFPGMPSAASAASAPFAAAPFAPTPALVTDHASVEWPKSKSKSPLIIGGVVALVVVIGIVAFVVGGKPETPPATSIAASPPTPNAPAPTPEPQTPAPDAPATPTAPTPGNTSQTGADTATGSDPIAAGSEATPGAGFAELFAAGARKAESKGATAAPAQRFDVAATKTPLAKAAAEAQSCKQSGGPTGKVTVVVTFDPNGKVASVTVSEPPFAGTSTGTCIASTLKRIAIPPFSGLPGSVSKTFSIL